MTEAKNDPIVDHILESEGWPKYTNHAADRGGPTKGGITIATLREYRGRSVTVQELQKLGESEARQIYSKRYITDHGFDKIKDELLRWQVVDAGVLSGQTRAARWLQEAAGADVDGRVGPNTLASVNGQNPHVLAIRFCAIRTRALMRLVTNDPTQAVWAAGWANRATSFLDKEALR